MAKPLVLFTAEQKEKMLEWLELANANGLTIEDLITQLVWERDHATATIHRHPSIGNLRD